MLCASCSVMCYVLCVMCYVFSVWYHRNCVLQCVSLPEWSKGLRSGRNVFERVGSNPTADIFCRTTRHNEGATLELARWFSTSRLVQKRATLSSQRGNEPSRRATLSSWRASPVPCRAIELSSGLYAARAHVRFVWFALCCVDCFSIRTHPCSIKCQKTVMTQRRR